MSISDEDLRKELGKYMDSVPPVTSSTRPVLLSKLKKVQLAHEFDDIQGEKLMEVKTPSAKHQYSRRSTSTNVVEVVSSQSNLLSSPIKETPLTSLQSKRDNLMSDCSDESYVFEDGEYRVRRFPPTSIPDYPSGIPVYRRRSLHPALSDPLPDPYEEIILRSPRALAKLDAQRIISRVMGKTYGDNNGDFYEYKKSGRRNFFLKMTNLKPVLNFFVHMCTGLLGLLLIPFSFIRTGFSFLTIPRCRTISFLLLVCCLVGIAVFFFHADPFFHNPVDDFAAFVAEPLGN